MMLYGAITLGMILLTEAAEGKGDIGKRRILAIAGTGGIHLPDVSGNRMVETCPIVKWFGN